MTANLKTGMKFSATIKDTECIGTIYVDSSTGARFLCQDFCDGDYCKNTLGHKFSWNIGTGTEPLASYAVNYFKVLDRNSATSKEWFKGDTLKHSTLPGQLFKIAFLQDEIIILTNLENKALMPMTIAQAFNRGYRLDTPIIKQDAQWAKDTFVVPLKDDLQGNSLPKGTIAEIADAYGDLIRYKSGLHNTINGRASVAAQLAWFETFAEAEAFVAREFPPKEVYLTLQEISEGKGKGVPVHLLKIIQ